MLFDWLIINYCHREIVDHSKKTKHAFVCHISLWRKSYWKMLSYEAWELFPLNAVWKKASCLWSTACIHDKVIAVAVFLCCSFNKNFFCFIFSHWKHGDAAWRNPSQILLSHLTAANIMTSILAHARRTLWNILLVKLWDWTRGHRAADSTLGQTKQDWWCFHRPLQ